MKKINLLLLIGLASSPVLAYSFAQTTKKAQAAPQQAAHVSQGISPQGKSSFRPNSPVVTVRSTVVVITSVSGHKNRVAVKKGQRLTFYSAQMTRDSIVRLPNGRLGFVHTRDIRPTRP